MPIIHKLVVLAVILKTPDMTTSHISKQEIHLGENIKGQDIREGVFNNRKNKCRFQHQPFMLRMNLLF